MLISEQDFNNQKLLEIYRAAYMKAEMADDGEIKVDVEGTLFYANADMDRMLLIVRRANGLKPTSQRARILEYCNEVNVQLNMIRCYFAEFADGRLVFFDHATDLHGGVTGEEIIDVTRALKNRVVAAWELDKEELLT